MRINPDLIASENYSTTESIVGKWINNKPIYRKVFTGTSLSTIFTGISNLDEMVKMEMLVREPTSSKGWRSIPWLYNATDTNWMGGFFFQSNDGGIRFQLGNSLKNIDKYIIILEYTKTTD